MNVEQDIRTFILANRSGGTSTLHREEFLPPPDLVFQGKTLKVEQLHSLRATMAKVEPLKPNRAEKALKAAFGGDHEEEEN